MSSSDLEPPHGPPKLQSNSETSNYVQSSSPNPDLHESPRVQGPHSALLSKQTRATSDFREESYFAKLITYGLERISREPELLAAEKEQLKRQTEETAVKNYKGFIEVNKCLKILQNEVSSINYYLEALSEDLPVLNGASTEFSSTAKEHLGSQQQNRHLLKQQAALQEILEVPSLMETCVRNGNLDDALDLRSFIIKISLLHPNVPVVRMLVREADVVSQEMLVGLLERLCGNIQLPECLRLVAHLRRLVPFSEVILRQTYARSLLTSLRIFKRLVPTLLLSRFLQCREEWLAELISNLDSSNAYDYLKRLTDVNRLQLFDVVMQFRAIFAEESAQENDSGQGAVAEAVFSWAEHRVVSYLETLAEHLPRIREGGGLASVLEHCMYCGMSLGRVGLDFRSLLPPIFETCILSLFASSVQVPPPWLQLAAKKMTPLRGPRASLWAQAAVEACLRVLESHKWVSLSPAGLWRSRSAAEADSGRGRTPGKAESSPERALMEHPPLAILANGLLAALNELRHCAPVALQSKIAAVTQADYCISAWFIRSKTSNKVFVGHLGPCYGQTCRWSKLEFLQEALRATAGAFSHYRRVKVLGDEEAGNLDAACLAFINTLCPFASSSIQQVFQMGPVSLDVSEIETLLIVLPEKQRSEPNGKSE